MSTHAVSTAGGAHGRAASLTIPGTLNLLLASAVIVSNGALLWFASHASSWWAIALYPELDAPGVVTAFASVAWAWASALASASETIRCAVVSITAV